MDSFDSFQECLVKKFDSDILFWVKQSRTGRGVRAFWRSNVTSCNVVGRQGLDGGVVVGGKGGIRDV